MDQKDTIQSTDPDNLKATAASSTNNAYIIATFISVLLIISGVRVIYFLKFQVETGLTKTNAGSSSSHVQNIDRIFSCSI
jgi:hypothetical protein